MNECEICPILQNPTETEAQRRLIEGEHWVATLREDQEYLGTAFVTARRHVESLPDLSLDEELEFIEVRNRLIIAQQRAFGAQVVNTACLMNNAFDSEGVGTPHVHYHFKPRYAQIVQFAGETFVDTQFGRYITEKTPKMVEELVSRQIVDRLRQEISSTV